MAISIVTIGDRSLLSILSFGYGLTSQAHLICCLTTVVAIRCHFLFLTAVLPFDEILSEGGDVSKIIRLLRLMRLVRLFRIFKLSRIVQKWKTHFYASCPQTFILVARVVTSFGCVP